MPTMLIKFTQKRDARLFLRQNFLQNNKKSSLYKIKYDCHLELDPGSTTYIDQQGMHVSQSLHGSLMNEDFGLKTEIYYLLIEITPDFAVENKGKNVTYNKFVLTPHVEIINVKAAAEELLFAWALSEINNDIKFIEYETQSSAKAIANDKLLSSMSFQLSPESTKTEVDPRFKPVNNIDFLHETVAESYLGRVIKLGNIEIVRAFEPLFDVMAVFNYTANSFSDGGVYNSPDKLTARIVEQLKYGATIIDIGVESTRPNVQLLSSHEEISILQEILLLILELKKWYKFILSIDTYHNETVLWLLDNYSDFDIINDVSGNIDVAIVRRLVGLNRKYIAMHNLGIPPHANNIISLEQNPIDVINAFFMKKKQEFLNAGISENEILNNVIFDPGIGFGNNAPQAWYIIKNIDKIDTLGLELLLGHSRKSFLNHITAKPYKDRDVETTFIALQVANSVDYVRIHEARILRRILPFRDN